MPCNSWCQVIAIVTAMVTDMVTAHLSGLWQNDGKTAGNSIDH